MGVDEFFTPAYAESLPGMHGLVLEARYSEIFGYFDPDYLASQERPPAHVEAAWREVFHDAGGDSCFKLRFDPWLKRWCGYEHVWLASEKRRVWQRAMIFAGPAVERELPSDYRTDDGRYEDLRGRIGEYKLPDKADFEEFKAASDRRLGTPKERAAYWLAEHKKEQREGRRVQRDFERDFCDYYFALASRDANREAGSMQGLPFVPQTSLEQFDREREASRYHIQEVRNAAGELLYKVRQRKREPITELMILAERRPGRLEAAEAALLSEREARLSARGLNRGVSRSEEERSGNATATNGDAVIRPGRHLPSEEYLTHKGEE